MENLMRTFCKIPRYLKAGKEQFRKEVTAWAETNMDKFSAKVEQSFLYVNIIEFVKIVALIISFSTLFYLLEEYDMINIYSNVLIFLGLYLIEFKIIFFILPIIISSRNLIFEKNCTNPKYDIIICAHYDTKNCYLKNKKGSLRRFFKYNLYNISRILGGFIKDILKYASPLIYVSLLMLVLNPVKAKSAFIMFDYPYIFLILILNISITIFIYGFFTSILVYIFSMTYVKSHNNPAADDNTSGVTAVLEIASYFNNIDLNGNLRVILFDNEEKGLIGSSHYANKNSKALKASQSIVINIDCVGIGEDICLVSSIDRGNKILRIFKEYLSSKDLDYGYSNMDYTDHIPFENIGLDTVSIVRCNKERYLWNEKFPVIDWIHGSEDDIESIDFNKISDVAAMVKDIIYYIDHGLKVI